MSVHACNTYIHFYDIVLLEFSFGAGSKMEDIVTKGPYVCSLQSFFCCFDESQSMTEQSSKVNNGRTKFFSSRDF
jgi:hypothetical protein